MHVKVKWYDQVYGSLETVAIGKHQGIRKQNSEFRKEASASPA